MTTARMDGEVAPGFEPARQAFEDNFRRRGEVGAGFCVFKDGEKVVDLWGGKADRATGEDWKEDTLCLIFSATKGLVATACLMAAERGLLDYDQRISELWPAFGAAGKTDITIGQVMTHRSGVVAIDTPLSIDDFERADAAPGDDDADNPVRAALERQAPLWDPGTRQGYHGVTFGPIMSEVFRRAVGKSLGQFLREEVAKPLDADVWLGLPQDQEQRVATLYPATLATRLFKALPYVLTHPKAVEKRLLKAIMNKESTTARAFASPADLGASGLQNFNLPNVHRLELAWASGIATARGLARVYAALSMGGALGATRLCGAHSIEALHRRSSFQSPDEVLLKPVGWTQGFIKEEGHLFSPSPESFGHPGMGGALGFCDPTQRLAWAYIPNGLDFRLRSPRAIALSHAVYDCLR